MCHRIIDLSTGLCTGSDGTKLVQRFEWEAAKAFRQ